MSIVGTRKKTQAKGLRTEKIRVKDELEKEFNSQILSFKTDDKNAMRMQRISKK